MVGTAASGSDAAQAQNPSSDPALPLAGMQTKPLISGGRTSASWSSDRIRTDHLEMRIGRRLSWKGVQWVKQ